MSDDDESRHPAALPTVRAPLGMTAELELERRVAAQQQSTPTPVVPASVAAATPFSLHVASKSGPAAELTALEDAFELPERAFFHGLEERARRAELMTALLRAGGLPAASAVRALQAALGAIVASANDAHLPSLAALSTALRTAIAHLGLAAPADDDARVVDTVVFDESELSRDLVALAVEAHGHTVRCAGSYEELVDAICQRPPVLLVTELSVSNAPPAHFARTLRELLSPHRVHVVLFSDLESGELDELARLAGARRQISKDLGVDALLAQLRSIFAEILDVRSTGSQPKFVVPHG